MTKTDDIDGYEIFYEVGNNPQGCTLSISIHKDGTGYATGFSYDSEPNTGQIVSRIAQEFAKLKSAKLEADNELLTL